MKPKFQVGDRVKVKSLSGNYWVPGVVIQPDPKQIVDDHDPAYMSQEEYDEKVRGHIYLSSPNHFAYFVDLDEIEPSLDDEPFLVVDEKDLKHDVTISPDVKNIIGSLLDL